MGGSINVRYIESIVAHHFNTAKFEPEGLSESMSHRVEQFGTEVIFIEPAFLAKDFHKNAEISMKSETISSRFNKLALAFS
jgi:hypothetical protein